MTADGQVSRAAAVPHQTEIRIDRGFERDIAATLRAADLYGDLELPGKAALRDYLPGLAVVVAATMAAGYISDHYGAPLTLMALLVGLALNFLGEDRRLAAGLTFASRTLLRWGIVLVGARITLGQIVDLGPAALIAVMAIVTLTMATGILASRLLGFGAAFGTLAGGAVAICGASAAMALATTLGEKRISQAQLTLVLVTISALSSLAMVVYPALAHQAQLGDAAAGFLLGAAIHDVAQALGAGYSFSLHAGDIAAIVKLTRVAMLAPILMMVAFFLPREDGKMGAGGVLPWFVIGFFALAGVNSTGVIPPALSAGAQTGSAALLACAVTATGIRAPMGALLGTGPRPMAVAVAATVVALAAALAGAIWVIG